jgi:hypothetical protein
MNDISTGLGLSLALGHKTMLNVFEAYDDLTRPEQYYITPQGQKRIIHKKNRKRGPGYTKKAKGKKKNR